MHPQPLPSLATTVAARRHMTRRAYKAWLEARIDAGAAWDALTDEDRADLVTFARPASQPVPHPQGSRLQRRRRSLTPQQHARLDRETSRQRIADLRADGKPLPGQLTDPTFRQSASSRG